MEGRHPVTYGLPAEVALFQDKPIAFVTTLPGGEGERDVPASYPETARDMLLSGCFPREEKLEERKIAQAFGPDYEGYRKSVPWMIPFEKL